jgi:hypothetical protein
LKPGLGIQKGKINSQQNALIISGKGLQALKIEKMWRLMTKSQTTGH